MTFVVVFLGLIGLPLVAAAVSSAVGLAPTTSSSSSTLVFVSFYPILERRASRGLVVQLLLKCWVSLGSFYSAQFVSATPASLLISSAEIASSGPLLPGDLDLPLDFLHAELVEIISLTDHLGEIIHRWWELGEDDEAFQMLWDRAIRLGHTTKVS